MRPQLDIQGVNIVLRGHFNPAIFHPSWFAAQELIGQLEADEAAIELIHPEAAIFNTDWLQIRVVRNRFQAGTAQEPYYEPLRDLVVGVFSFLSHRSRDISRGGGTRRSSAYRAWGGVLLDDWVPQQTIRNIARLYHSISTSSYLDQA